MVFSYYLSQFPLHCLLGISIQFEDRLSGCCWGWNFLDLFDNNGGGTIDSAELKETLDSVGIEIDQEDIEDVND